MCVLIPKQSTKTELMDHFQVIIGLQIFGSSTFEISMYDNEVYEYPAMALVIGKASTAVFETWLV